MKKVFALFLVFALVMSLGVSAFAANSPVSPSGSDEGDITVPVVPVIPDEEEDEDKDENGNMIPDELEDEAEAGAEDEDANTKEGFVFDIVDDSDETVAVVPAEELIIVPVKEADQLSDEDKEAFLAAYEEAKAVEDKLVKYFFWLDVPETYKNVEDFSAFKFTFTCTGDNVVVLVNGKPMKVVKLDGNKYCAYLTEFGAVSILTAIKA